MLRVRTHDTQVLFFVLFFVLFNPGGSYCPGFEGSLDLDLDVTRCSLLRVDNYPGGSYHPGLEGSLDLDLDVAFH